MSETPSRSFRRRNIFARLSFLLPVGGFAWMTYRNYGLNLDSYVAGKRWQTKTTGSLPRQGSLRDRQGFGLPEDLLEWNIIDDEDVNLNRNFTKTVCTTDRNKKSFPVSTIRSMFSSSSSWKFVVESSKNPNACRNSRIRVLFDNSATARTRIQHHVAGQQLTTSIVGASTDKGVLGRLVNNSTSLLLKHSLPVTRVFDSVASCERFCDDEFAPSTTKQQQKWIWKPVVSAKGNGISLINDSKSCRDGCCRTNGRVQAQVLTPTMLDYQGRKFDVRSHLLVAHVDPLVVFAGAERVRVCAEPMNVTDPVPWPDVDHDHDNGWNPFQHVCNRHVGVRHPTRWTPSGNVRPLSSDVIPDDAVRQRVLRRIDEVNGELVSLLRHRWSNVGVGSFQVLAVDYLVDVDERIRLLEINKQPGFSGTGVDWPNPWEDVFRVEWELVKDFHRRRKSGNNIDAKKEDEKQESLSERLSDLKLETLRILHIDYRLKTY